MASSSTALRLRSKRWKCWTLNPKNSCFQSHHATISNSAWSSRGMRPFVRRYAVVRITLPGPSTIFPPTGSGS